MPPQITAGRLRQIVIYDAQTGVFTWLYRSDMPQWWNTRFAGTEAGSPNSKGKICIGIGGHLYLASRLAVVWMTGEWPSQLVDHENLAGDDNRWANLRAATHSQNSANRAAHANSKSGIKGVSWRQREQKWSARIMRNYKEKWLGLFDTAEAASDAYAKAATELFGKFARAA